jgi:hypothetical protein
MTKDHPSIAVPSGAVAADYPGNLFVVSAPSGTGKSSLVNALLEVDSRLQVSVSHTTRAPRGQEQHGREYLFTSKDDFLAMVGRGEFFEHAEVHGNCYGTSRKAIEDRIKRGEDIVLEIDWQGALQIKKHLSQRHPDLHHAAELRGVAAAPESTRRGHPRGDRTAHGQCPHRGGAGPAL